MGGSAGLGYFLSFFMLHEAIGEYFMSYFVLDKFGKITLFPHLTLMVTGTKIMWLKLGKDHDLE